MCRQQLLSLGDVREDYGSSPTWWSGDTNSRVGLGLVITDDDEGRRIKLLHETQRLMAFLEGTERLYACPHYLACDLGDLFDPAPEDSVEAFASAWEIIAYSELSQTNRTVPRMFRSTRKRLGQVSKQNNTPSWCPRQAQPIRQGALANDTRTGGQ